MSLCVASCALQDHSDDKADGEGEGGGQENCRVVGVRTRKQNLKHNRVHRALPRDEIEGTRINCMTLPHPRCCCVNHTLCVYAYVGTFVPVHG